MLSGVLVRLDPFLFARVQIVAFPLSIIGANFADVWGERKKTAKKTDDKKTKVRRPFVKYFSIESFKEGSRSIWAESTV